MGTRLELQATLEELAGTGVRVYFQPPSNTSMTYPCVIYERSNEDTKYANDGPYLRKKRYTVTVIDQNPDSLIPDRVASLPLCSYSRGFKTSNLNHDAYNLYF